MEWREDRVLGRAVVIARHRNERPNNFAPRQWPVITPADCPFCVGNESQTPSPLDERTIGGRWQIRVVPNRYPVLGAPGTGRMPTGDPRSAAGSPCPAPAGVPPPDGEARCEPTAAVGAHEVIIEAPRHVCYTSQLRVEEVQLVLDVYAARLRSHRQTGGNASGVVFKNLGPSAGASLVHLHSQLVAFQTVPPRFAWQYERLADYRDRTGRCLLCDRLEQECRDGSRLVARTGHLAAWCPPVSLQPYEFWIAPLGHAPAFEDESGEMRAELANLLHRLLSRLESILEGGGYNLMLHTAPWKPGDHCWMHWRVEVLPRVNTLAGLELATGLHVNHVPPEAAAEALR